MSSHIAPSAVVVTTKQQVFVEVEDEFIILNTDTGVYYGLEAAGAHVWRCLQQPAALADVCASVMSAYDVDAERCARDITALVEHMAAEGLVEVHA